MTELTPQQIVAELDKYIVGQRQAKRSVAIALRNRWRSRFLPETIKDDVIPKNILMIGPTGVGKTEIARRLSKLVQAPFIKVEATKFTEVGYVGRDVESIIRDLTETAVRMVKQEKFAEVNDRASCLAEQRIIECFYPLKRKTSAPNPFELLFSDKSPAAAINTEEVDENKEHDQEVLQLQEKLQRGELDDELIEIAVEEVGTPVVGMLGGANFEEMGIQIQDMLGSLLPKKQKKRRVTVANARKIFTQEEANKLIDMEDVASKAIERAENAGIIFLDEIDKVAGRNNASGPDVSREGVQRDILPIVEGSTVITKYGPVKTDHMLFIAAGAFHISKPTDLIPELQGRFPIRVELTNLSKADFIQILTEPANALLKQYSSLLAVENIALEFQEDAIDELAEVACQLNTQSENIGARRLHTILEKLLEDISFDAPNHAGEKISIDRHYVKERLSSIVANQDLSQYIL